MTMSEKRYFKIFSERHTIGEQNKYLLLFDLIDKVEIEDDTFLKSELKSLGINSDFLSADKNYLYNLILRSLNIFHSAKTYNLEIKETLISIEILFHKGLYHECLKLISKAEILADECENFQLSIDLLIWKKKCSGYSLGLKKAAEVNLRIDKYILLLNNLKKITDLYYESNILQANNEKYSQKEVINKFEKILLHNELKSEKNALSFSAKIYYYLIFSNYYYATDNKVKEYENLQKLIDLINQSKTYAQENPLDYVSIYNRLLNIKKHFPNSNFFEDIKILQEFTKQVQFRKEIINERVFIHTNTHELEFHLIGNDFEKALSKITYIEKEINKLQLEIEPYHLIYFYYLNAILLIYVGQFHKALKYVNKILNEFEVEERPQVYLRVKILNAIIHYELHNYDLVISICMKILKKNKSNNLLIKFENNLLEALLKISSAEQFTFKEEFAVLKSLISEKQSAKENKKIIQNSLIENYEKWIVAKLKKKRVNEL